MRGEFEFIERMKSRYGLSQVGDDCAILPKDDQYDTLITADLLIEDIDFRLEWSAPRQIGHKALAVSLSDIAAMGGTPNWAMLSLGLPEKLWKTDFAEAFYDGWHRLARQFAVEMIGGDISRTPDRVVIDSIVGGQVLKGKAIVRSGAKAGDAIYISGTVGAAAGGLRVLQVGDSNTELIRRQLEPSPQISLGNRLMSGDLASAAIDVSDGLSSDLTHLCTASGVGALIRRDLIPVDQHLRPLFTEAESLDLALNGGEDFELIFTGRPGQDVAGTTYIGDVTQNAGVIELTDGKEVIPLLAAGFRHF